MHDPTQVLLLQLSCIIVFIILAKVIGYLNQALVLGQLCAGIIIAIFAHYKINFFMGMIHNDVLLFLAELGSIFLLFEIGLESSLSEIIHAGKHAIIVALTGVIIPFIVGYFIVTPFILSNLNNLGTLSNLGNLSDLSNLNNFSNNTLNNISGYNTGYISFINNLTNVTSNVPLKIFIGSMFAVTSTGISISVFKELKMLKSTACQIVLAASIIDDIFGLTLLSIITGLAVANTINIMQISITLIYIVLFFIFGILFGQKILPKIINLFAIISNNVDTLVLIMISYALAMAYIASSIGLASVIGAFLAGLLLEEIYFNRYKYPQYYKKSKLDDTNSINSTNTAHIHTHTNNANNNNSTSSANVKLDTNSGESADITINPINMLEHLIKPFGKLLTPIFFIYAGMQVDIIASLNFLTLKITLIISIFAIISKMMAGIFLPKTKSNNRLIIGIGMIPRGEIGLIFAISGLNLKIINPEIFASLVLMIIITSIFTPPVLTYATKKSLLDNV